MINTSKKSLLQHGDSGFYPIVNQPGTNRRHHILINHKKVEKERDMLVQQPQVHKKQQLQPKQLTEPLIQILPQDRLQPPIQHLQNIIVPRREVMKLPIDLNYRKQPTNRQIADQISSLHNLIKSKFQEEPPKVDAQEKKRYKKRRRCFTCNKLGHVTKDCYQNSNKLFPYNRNKDTSSPSSSSHFRRNHQNHHLHLQDTKPHIVSEDTLIPRPLGQKLKLKDFEGSNLNNNKIY